MSLDGRSPGGSPLAEPTAYHRGATDPTGGEVVPFEETKLWRKHRQRVQQGVDNDMVIALTPSAKTGVSGTGKTTLAIALARHLDCSESGFDAEANACVDAATLAYELLPTAERGSAIIFDEAQGAAGTDSINKRRGMKDAAMDAINGILAARDQNHTIIIVGQQLAYLDTNLLPLIDVWLLLRYAPTHPRGPLAYHHTFYIEDYDLESPDLKTPKKEPLSWSPVPTDSADYQHLSELKQAAKQKGGGEDGDDGDITPPQSLSEMPTEHRDPIIRDLAERGITEQTLADAADLTQQRINQIRQDD